MTRKRKSGKQKQGTGVFHHSPFAALKGVIGKASPSPPEAPKASAHEDHEDEHGLFLRSVNGVRKIAQDDDRGPAQLTAPAAPGAPGIGEEGDRELFLRALGTIGTAGFRDRPQEREEEAPERFSSGRMRQLRRGTIRIIEELDLHGFLKDEAIRRLEHFIESAVARGLQAVLVITGKGTNSPEGPVLPGAVDTWLRERGKGKVAEFHPAPRDRGGSGAYVVFLKRR